MGGVEEDGAARLRQRAGHEPDRVCHVSTVGRRQVSGLLLRAPMCWMLQGVVGGREVNAGSTVDVVVVV